MNQNYCLYWNNFTEHLQDLFANLYREESYADVTLVSSDKFEFKAHKIVLSACSPVLKKIIDDSPRDLPLVYKTKIQSQEMEAILHFMYIGEGKFYQERMEEFIKAAKDLKIKNFSESLKNQAELSTADKNTVLEKEEKGANKDKLEEFLKDTNDQKMKEISDAVKMFDEENDLIFEKKETERKIEETKIQTAETYSVKT